MNKFKIFSITFLIATAIGQAQDMEQAKKSMDGEQFEKAKTILKNIIKTNPNNGKASFLLGNIYLKQSIEDSAKISFQKGLSASDGARFNTIGLGQIDLDSGNTTAAQAKFDEVLKALKKRDIEEYVCIAKAYMNNSKPDYKAAITLLTKAQSINQNDATIKLALGDAYYGDKNQNDAYASYRDAYNDDNTLIRAKMQLGVLLKGAKAYNEAIKALDEVAALNPNYGPVYREYAETYYYWASNQPGTYKENIAKALSNYEKYMSLTDYSLTSRMRHADFLILAKDYKSLEVEANKMKELDKVNPRILRYLGYSAYQNGNYDAAISALTDYTTKGTNKIISGDYFYLGLSNVGKSVGTDGKTIDATLLTNGITDLKKTLDMDIAMANGLNEIGKKYFTQKLYNVASPIFELAISNPDSRNYLEDNVYYGLSVLAENRGKDAKLIDKIALEKADKSMDNVIVANATYQEAYLYKARINNTLEKDDVMAINYQKYVDLVLAKGADEVTKNKAKITEAYNTTAAFFANTDKAKAIDYFNKTLALDPTNSYATESIKILSKK
jgi:tetratricopeptide (TPR) repeat protein